MNMNSAQMYAQYHPDINHRYFPIEELATVSSLESDGDVSVLPLVLFTG